jgi:hypothetical protein
MKTEREIERRAGERECRRERGSRKERESERDRH